MNKILNINLGGYALTIDDDAYEYLTAYIESIRKRFSESEGRDEIVHDIESRLGEIISQSMGNRTIVMLPDVEAAVEIMGKPEEFGADPISGGSGSGSSSGSSSGTKTKARVSSTRTGKRLFRDEEDAVVGGVCSGLAAYFGMTDPVWMRLIFVLVTFLSAGFWIPAYLLLWILVPPAQTAADRLAMRGEPINVDNIAREIEDSFERLSTKVNQYGSEKKSGARGGDRSFSNAISSGVSVIGQVFAFVLRFLAKFGLIIAAILAIGLFIALAVSWAAGIWALFATAPFVDYFSPFSGAFTWLGFANLFFLLGIPVLALILTFVRALFKARTPTWLHAGLWIFWTLNLVSGVILLSIGSKNYRSGGTFTKNIDLSGISSDTLRVEAADVVGVGGEDFWLFDENDGLRVNDDRVEIRDLVEIRVRRSDSGNFKYIQNVSARGHNSTDAVANAEQTEFPVTFSGNTLRIPTAYGIPKGQKWRGQRVRIYIEVPAGKSIVFDDKIYRRAAADMEEYNEDNEGNYISRRPEKVFRMTNGGLLCTGCPQFGDQEYTSEEYYEHFIFEGNFETEMRKGDEFKIRIEGPAGAIEKIRTGRKLTLAKRGDATGVKVYIESPVFTSLIADNTGDITIRGFEEGDASLTVKGTSKVKAYIDVSSQFNLSLSGKCSLELAGSGGQMDVSMNDGAVLEALNWRARDAEITASDGSKARLHAEQDALVISDATSQVKVEGGARIRNARYE